MTHHETRLDLKTEILIFKVLTAAFIIIALLQVGHVLYLKYQQAQVRSQLVETRIDLDYYESTFKERVGTVYDEYGTPQTIRIVSIDGGDNWLVTSQSREVKQSRYLAIAYPEVDPDSLQVVQ